MREIKFRVWAASANRMSTGDIGLHNAYCFAGGDNVFMQFTGLKDKNGVEIYEGDIVNVPYNDLGNHVVEFKDGAYNTTRYNVSQVRVIGNIYEHPNY